MIRPYWNYRDEITAMMDLMLKSKKIIFSKALQHEMLGRIHIGVQKSLTFNKNIQTR